MMNRLRFRLLVFFMSLSLIGIILVQLYWVNSSLKSSEDQFASNVKRTLQEVNSKFTEIEYYNFFKIYNRIKEDTGRIPDKLDLIQYLEAHGYDIQDKPVRAGKGEDEGFFDLDTTKEFENFNRNFSDNGMTIEGIMDEVKNRKRDFAVKENLNFEFLLNFYIENKPIEKLVSEEYLEKILKDKLSDVGIETPFEFAIVSVSGGITKIKSNNFKYDKSRSYDVPVFANREGKSSYRLVVSFPQKETFLFLSLLGITSLSIVFTLIIIIAYLSAINQLIKQKQISEIKTDFINNMTHEFKTPIATINLALDAIKNPKIFDDREKVQRYLQMIREENKRMHSQVENVLQISKLDRKELDITKNQADIHDVIEEAIAHVHLIIEDREGKLTRHFHAQRTTALLNDVHFTNVLVNILDNAIKYSQDEPVIDIYTENIKDFILIKISDKGLGMSKTTQKRIFEKFYREHTGDIHNVKGHGLGLAYVKRIIDDHNCHIYVESEKGKGSTFIIKMPLIN